MDVAFRPFLKCNCLSQLLSLLLTYVWNFLDWRSCGPWYICKNHWTRWVWRWKNPICWDKRSACLLAISGFYLLVTFILLFVKPHPLTYELTLFWIGLGFHLDTEESDNLLPGFLDSIIGIRQGETKSFPLQFPESWEQENLRGVRAQFTVS